MKKILKRLLRIEKICFFITVALLLFYSMLMLYFCLQTDAMVPDEAWFYGIAESMGNYSFREYLRTPNELGYGSIYWITYALLKSKILMRAFSWFCMILIPVCFIVILKNVLHRTWKNILIAIILFLSCPMAWFTGKIIGPELYGNALGAAGVTIFFCGLQKTKKLSWFLWLGGGSVLLGISAGIKLYNLIFALFAGLYAASEDISYKDLCLNIKLKYIVLKGSILTVGCTVGFIIANPMILWDKEQFYRNMIPLNGTPSIESFIELFTLKRIEWDLVNSGGLCHVIISIAGLAGIFILGLVYRESRQLSVISLITFVVFMVLFSAKGGVYGWYYIPLLFILPLCMNEKNIYWFLLAVNLVFLYPDTYYQIESKFAQIENVKKEALIEKYIEEKYEAYAGYERINYVDVGLKNMGMDSQYKKRDNQFICISERAKYNVPIQQIYNMAVSGEGGYKLVDEKYGISIIVCEQ